jgi:hypothetical protein
MSLAVRTKRVVPQEQTIIFHGSTPAQEEFTLSRTISQYGSKGPCKEEMEPYLVTKSFLKLNFLYYL